MGLGRQGDVGNKTSESVPLPPFICSKKKDGDTSLLRRVVSKAQQHKHLIIAVSLSHLLLLVIDSCCLLDRMVLLRFLKTRQKSLQKHKQCVEDVHLQHVHHKVEVCFRPLVHCAKMGTEEVANRKAVLI